MNIEQKAREVAEHSGALFCRSCGKLRTRDTCRSFQKENGKGLRLYFLCRDCERAKSRLRDRNKYPVKGGKWRYSKKSVARAKVASALRNGTLVRKPCEVCGAKAQAHHSNYDEPLNVRWLCRTHHGMEHWMPTASPLVEAAIRARGQKETA